MGFLRPLLMFAIALFPAVAWPAHPLITDDTGTQGRGRYELELNGQYDRDKELVDGASVKAATWQAGASLSYGLGDEADLVVGIPYQWLRTREDHAVVSKEGGLSDATVELKWRFFQKEGLSLAVKPGLRLPTGREEKGLGAGRTGYQLYLIGSLEAAPWALHANGGYLRNENGIGEEKDLWHASLAATHDLGRGITLVANLGLERNPDRAAGQDPAFFLGGVIYNLTDRLAFDLGVKYGLTDAETDWSLLAGVALRF